jgi:lipopolysaccharide/colanic/teichoic acid biosynthesis glycosyltransferase
MKLQESTTGFYYVGTKRANITKLVYIYKRGFASGNLDQALTELTTMNHFFPEVICCESEFGFPAIQKWAAILSKNERLARVPLIIDADRATTIENFHFVSNKTADDILDLKEWTAASLHSKIRFLQKYKTKTRDLDKQKRDELVRLIPLALGNIVKRVLDIMISVAALIIFSPLFILISLAIRIESGGSVIYISKRAGKGYRIFNFYKFRTMYRDAEKRRVDFAHLNQYNDSELARFFKVKDDPRITRVGRILRNSSLDELPQLYNVLIGDMSLVGNRPLPLYEAESMTTNALAERFLAPAGMTGLWQIQKRGKDQMSENERIRLDLDYANKSNILMDMWIMANTPQAIIQKTNT